MIGKTTRGRIRSERELDEAIQSIDSLLDRAKSLTTAEKARLDDLSARVRQYEDIHYPSRNMPAGESLRRLLSLHETSVEELARITGVPSSVIRAVMNATRQLTGDQAGKLARHFRLKANAFASSRGKR